jgi:hypothetical protein
MSFCAVFTGATIRTTDNPADPNRWQQASFGYASEITGLSCASADLCVAVDNAGEVYWSDDPGSGNEWSVSAMAAAQRQGYSAQLNGVSCPTDSFCAAVSNTAVAVSTDPAAGASQRSAPTARQPHTA